MECKISFQCIENQDKLTKLQQQIAELVNRLNTAKNDYWFMTALLRRSSLSDYSADSVKDCIERMEFRKPMFEILAKYSSETK